MTIAATANLIVWVAMWIPQRFFGWADRRLERRAG